ncbi:hypothetical protein PC129_g4402 [Phytophthora cactorum]|uniref:Uncharacterized protein n=1 Tax=Phytophthora cactorum TaxID=29920 RepID=A0A329RU40_9STRA|nr:hypothetical protein Pcac1_g1884 [Phytophthora cactorum]KAG2830730.1 hypothetical protein PC111_g7278 [Phytophthora cactorum]KAG2833562.1 hypothetical protein PC112_g6447 [Phytophthora cactorum]KAG2862209.1 hypothetical protein PC113_g6507 [Phytophthora cactorum]KAG2912126.1 hypothetical protein PC114_g9051 [Phytophthora cactorum]
MALYMFTFNTVLWLYFDKVMPKEYGTLIKWYFPVPPSYWGGRVQRRER